MKTAPIKSSGFSLLETIIYVGLIGVVLVSFVFFTLAVAGIRDKAVALNEVKANWQTASAIISRLLRSAKTIDTAASVFDSDQGKLVLLSAVDLSGPLTIALNSSGRLTVTTAAGSVVNLSDQEVSFSRLRFSRLSGDNIIIEVTLNYGPQSQSGTVAGGYSRQFKTAITVRQ